MIDINELRLLVQDYKLAGSPVFVQAADMNEILDRLEAAEKERDWNVERLEEAIEELTALRTKIESMERQEPVGEIQRANSTGNYICSEVWVPLPVGSKLYAAAGSKGEGK